VGTIAQLLNDIAGITNGSDLRRRKKTLPIAYALQCAKDEQIGEILQWFESQHKIAENEERALATQMIDLGALHFASVVAEAHRRKALEVLKELSETTGLNAEKGMKPLIPEIWTTDKKRGLA
jgi:geranylgeranyl pyrophosphate synthase